MSINENYIGIEPKNRDLLDQMSAGMNGELVLSVTPSTLGSSAAAVNTAIAGDGFTRDVLVKLVDSNGRTHTWCDKSFSVAASESTAGDGICSIVNSLSTIGLTDGDAKITLRYTGTWAEADTATLTVTGGEVMGTAVTNKTSVDTLIA
jgi:hypothetical protein